MTTGYYRFLLGQGDRERIAQVKKYIESTRIPYSLTEKIFDFLIFGEMSKIDYADHAALDELTLKVEKVARFRHNLSDKEKILFYRKRKDAVTFVFTDYGFSAKNNTGDSDWGEKYYYIPWESINRVEYNESTERFEFFSSSSKKPFDTWGRYTIIKDNKNPGVFADLITSIAKCYYIERIAYKRDLQDATIAISDKFKKCDKWLDYCVEYEECLDALYSKIDILLAEYKSNPNKEYLETAEGILDSIITYDESKFNNNHHGFIVKPEWSKMEHKITQEENEETLNRIRSYRIKIATLKGELREARQNILSILGSKNYKEKRSIIRNLDELESEEKWQEYTSNVEYTKRKLIMPLWDIAGCNSSNIEVFRMDHLPRSIQFPTGHPVPGTIYIGNPFIPQKYIPFEGYELEFFLSRVNEYCRIMQCLGATEISIRTIKGKSASEVKDKGVEVDLSGNAKAFSGSTSVNYQKKQSEERTSHTGIEIVQRFDPSISPYVPEDLIWYNDEPDWKSKVQQRLNGNMLEFSQKISTAQKSYVSKSQLIDVKAQAEYIWAKANLNVNIKSESEFKETEETEWVVYVKFRSLKEFEHDAPKQNTKQKLADNEEKYREEVLFYLEDNGVISDIERKFLEKKRIRLGISEECAKIIEESCMPQLTDAEKEFIDALKDLGDADIQNPRIRRMLDHEREDLGISEERAKELEQQYLHS